ncbi:isoleucine--tRNA ligase, mitochondrial [Schistocerca piceifrons]|uniref:isoleucine--tRNA ligase, mitochondrial n=1 Tax=Schistocerca piceifrons TaxID=274613 RepID=UPI001F5F06D8|nr:isoleucine--tRNA ligase, mitochondrial [Schistocerca piceifrons]
MTGFNYLVRRPVHYRCFKKLNRYSSSDTSVKHEGKAVRKKYSDTVNLPNTKFPARIEGRKRAERDRFIYEKCRFSSLYSWQREHTKDPEFILHDGPPYANGKPHMGHAINKIMKDIILRHKVLQGQRVHFIPGWDCHGLPIELKAVSSSCGKETKLTPVEIRYKARKFAEAAIANQKTTFKSWGVMGDWDHSYHTFDKKYVKNQIKKFYDMFEKGLIYRAYKPVFWSPSSRTALAEAELEYNPTHCSQAVTVRFLIKDLPPQLKKITPQHASQVYLLIWTTTPWTLPMTSAVCYSPEMTYSAIHLDNSKDELYILASECMKDLLNKTGAQAEVISSFKGDMLRNTFYEHPLKQGCNLPLLPSDHVSTGKGSGLVHTSPAHGHDDFLVALKHGISLECLVDEDGCFMSKIGPELEGLPVLSAGNEKVLVLLQNDILHQEKYTHSYPYDWRTKQPVIIRASKQWFIDTDAIKQTAINKLRAVNILPEKFSGSGQLISLLDRRPYWCISRQRVWGVPIPVLYRHSNQEILVTRPLIDHFCNLLEEHGPDFWWTLPTEKLVEGCVSDVDVQDIEKSQDILDIWFDSGISWSSVLDQKVADLYLEGVDQITGWFQSSLMTSVALREEPPYRAIFVHGFAVDGNGRKMSKSLGNVVDPVDITEGSKHIPAYGTDVLRWWVASHGTHHGNISISNNLLDSSADSIQKIRIVLRFILGSINDFQNKSDTDAVHLYNLDKYLLNLLFGLEKEVVAMYDTYQFNHVCKLMTNFVTNDLSALYCHLIKDRLYCESSNSPKRRACQLVLSHILEGVTHMIAPVLPFLAEEVYLHHPCFVGTGVFRSGVWKPLKEWEKADIDNIMSAALKLRDLLHKTSEESNTLKLNVKVFAGDKTLQILKLFQEEGRSDFSELTELLQVSAVELIKSNKQLSDNEFEIVCETSEHQLCPRCRRYTSKQKDVLCSRCEKIVSKQPLKQVLCS